MPALDPSSRPLDVIAAGETDRGVVRAANEDAVLVRGDLGLYVVADGAGGHSAGNVASAIATSTLAKYFDATDAEAATRPELDPFGLWTVGRRLSAGVQRANQAVIEIARSSNKYRGMGTTLVCAVILPETGRVHIAHVGDSRCYRLRQWDLELLTPDHSILNDVLELYPELDDAAIGRLPRKAVTRAIGMEERVRVAIRALRAQPGDRYLLCSDGITSELEEPAIAALLGQGSPPADIVRDLVRAAKDAGGRDNITALVVECRALPPGMKPVRPPPPPRRPSTKSMRAVPPPTSDPEVEVTGLVEVSNPEIVLIRPSSVEEGSDPRISVVPANSADAQMIRAIDGVAGALGAPDTACAQCGSPLDRGNLVCPRCGHSEAEPLSNR